MRAVTDQERVMMACHSLLRLDATPKKRCLTKLFIFKKFSFKQAFFINDISSSQVKVHKQFSDPNQFSQSSKRSKCLSRYQKTKKNQKKSHFFYFSPVFFMFLANCCFSTASLTLSVISGITLLFLLVLGMILIPSE